MIAAIAPRLVALAVAAVVGASAAWLWQAHRYTAEIDRIQLTQAQAALTALEVAHAETIRLQARKEQAEKLAAARQSDLARAAAAGRAALVSLSDAADEAIHTAQDSHSACLANARTLRVVFGECTQRRNEVAADAQGHLNDKITLTESWPQ